MLCEKLYESQPELNGCTASVLSCEKVENGYEVVLDKTVLFATGGGQPCDLGQIDGVPVREVYIRDGELYHLCESELKTGKTVEVVLDRERRTDHTCQHSGEHLLSYAFYKLFGLINVGFHMSEAVSTIDIDGDLTEQMIDDAENFANMQVMENLPVNIYFDTVDNLKSKGARKISEKAGENPRVVEFRGSDICTCCGTHVSHSGEIGIIKIIRHERMRGGTRLYFLCGKRALTDYRFKDKIISGLSTDFSCEAPQVTDRINLLKDQIAVLKGQLKAKSVALVKKRAAELVSDEKVILTCEEDCTPFEAKTLLNEVLSKTRATVIVTYADQDRIGYLCASENGGDCKFICDMLNGIFGGKGGGSKTFAQGSAPFCNDWISRADTVRNAIHI